MIDYRAVRAVGDWLIEQGLSTDEALDCYLVLSHADMSYLKVSGLRYQADLSLKVPSRVSRLCSCAGQTQELIELLETVLICPPSIEVL
ncbi:hypothetical protein Dxin01_00089 [Deinococcus xinjiangensis]|uniref:Uncharacterized protein n=1 Tax=Deinococcus xinjiangensis TaxID=457454 RepID=A0ABP9V507_9DEIO